VVEQVEDALEEALNTTDQDTIVLATGSIFVAAAVRDTWYNHRKIDNSHG
jgi:folylpolyglutamate synthase/dihydropteroate synthase